MDRLLLRNIGIHKSHVGWREPETPVFRPPATNLRSVPGPDGIAFLRRNRHFIAALAVAAAILPVGGCRTALATALWMVRGTNVDPDFKGLQQKRVAVICRPMLNLQFRNATVAKDLAREVNLLLGKNVPKIHLIDQQKVEQWLDENDEQEVAKIGKALKAEMVVAIDLEQFSLYQGQTVYQGKANVSVKVHDCKENRVVFEKTLPPTLYPPNTGIPTSDRQEPAFRREFVNVLADQIGRHFYAHDPHADMALDTAALR